MANTRKLIGIGFDASESGTIANAGTPISAGIHALNAGVIGYWVTRSSRVMTTK